MAGAITFNWWIIVILVALVWGLLKIRFLKHKLYMVLLLVLVLVLYTTSSVLIAKENIDLSSFDGFVALGKAYLSWAEVLFSNVKSITSNVVKMDWSYSNSTEAE